LATVVIGGLISATVLTLFILPLLYVLFEKPFRMRRKKNLLLLAILAFSSVLNAQQILTDEQFFDLGFNQNGQLKAEVIEAQRQQLLASGAAAWQPPWRVSAREPSFRTLRVFSKQIVCPVPLPFHHALEG
ncbi:MAG: hypothetical protein EBS01_08570, partial [Verrucomicrobia bacterium]|nr:hypothetical protein [Verrucomicrobiota bacterium]